jgi:hypothetical protein
MLGKIAVVSISLVILMVVLQIDRSIILFKVMYGISIVLIAASLAAYITRAAEFLKQKKNYESI